MPKFKEVNLLTICDGAPAEVFMHEFKRVLANIEDVNTDPEATRKISLVFKFEPSNDRSMAAISFQCQSMTTPVASAKSTMMITRQNGELKGYSNDTTQEPLFPDETTAAHEPATI